VKKCTIVLAEVMWQNASAFVFSTLHALVPDCSNADFATGFGGLRNSGLQPWHGWLAACVFIVFGINQLWMAYRHGGSHNKEGSRPSDSWRPEPAN